MGKEKKKYDLSNPKDREELKSYALNISEDTLLAVRDEMFKKDYREHVDELDVKLYYWLGEEAFDAYVHGMFKYDMLEAEYLKISPSHPYFKELVASNKVVAQRNMADLLPEMVYGAKIKHIDLLDENRIKSAIRAKWTKPENWKIKQSLEKLITDGK